MCQKLNATVYHGRLRKTGYTLMKSGLDLKHSPNFPEEDSRRNRGILEMRTATASTSPFSVYSITGEQKRDQINVETYIIISAAQKDQITERN